jgi:hypothetical protein
MQGATAAVAGNQGKHGLQLNYQRFMQIRRWPDMNIGGRRHFQIKRKMALPQSGCVLVMHGYAPDKHSRCPGSDNLIQPIPAKAEFAIFTCFKIAIRHKELCHKPNGGYVLWSSS